MNAIGLLPVPYIPDSRPEGYKKWEIDDEVTSHRITDAEPGHFNYPCWSMVETIAAYNQTLYGRFANP
jgi:hypothetical protein